MITKKRAVVTLFVILTIGIVYMLSSSTPTGAVIQENIFSGTVVSGDTVMIQNLNATFIITDSAAYVDFGEFSLILPGGECRTRDNFNVCAGAITFKERNYEEYVDIYEATIDFYMTQAIEVNKTIEKTTLLIGESSDVKVTIRNVGTTEATDIIYQDKYPSEISISNIEGCTLYPDNMIIWTGYQTPNARQICTYTLVGNSGTKFTSEAIVGYNDGVRSQNITGKITIEILNHSLNVRTNTNTTGLQIGNGLNITYELENIYNKEISVTEFKITIPTAFDIIFKDPYLQRPQTNTFHWIGTLQPNEKKNFTIHLFAKETNTFEIVLKKRYNVDGFTRNIVEKLPVDIGCDCPEVVHTTLRNHIPGDNIPFRVEIKNPGTHIFSNVIVNVTTNIQNVNNTAIIVDKLHSKESFFMFNQEITIPEESYQYNITLTYTTPFDQQIIQYKKIIIAPTPQNISKATNNTINNENESNQLEMTEKQKINKSEQNTSSKLVETPPQIEQPKSNKGVIASIIVLLIIGTIIFVFIRLMRD